MKLLVVGGGGREHALVSALAHDDPSHRILVAPGNPGTARLGTNLPIPADDIDALVEAARVHGPDLTIVGPEVPLALGLADRLRGEGRVVFGPGAAAARIESSKAFAKDVMHAAGVPTAKSRVFSDLPAALTYIREHPEPLVVKASGLAAGKGAVVCATRDEARHAVHEMLADRRFGPAGDEVVIESFLRGEELSVFAVTNGRDVCLLPAAQDHKRLQDGDQGPNTGGMGAYAPVSLATPELLERIRQDVLLPTLAELERRGAPFRGLLYAGLMIEPDGSPQVIEFNCRFGDPETEAVLPLIAQGLTPLLHAAARGESLPAPTIRPGVALTTVLASEGYPESPRRGQRISIPDDLPPGVTVFHAGTRQSGEDELVVAGGRVLAVTALAPTLMQASAASLAAATRIGYEGKRFRTDIGWRELARAHS